ncbi:MAG: GNAT family N-acetyltransferase [Candidatus Pacebacteria bacterium]|nr:GNAT family N-acetyltransferase [Candidatus Paceibacterota bacterium]
MVIKKKCIESIGIKFIEEIKGKEVGRAFLYILYNDLHEQPFGFLEDVFVEEAFRNRGIATSLVSKIIEEARDRQCYKIIATSRYSRPSVHALYRRLGFQDWGTEFRLNLEKV